MATPTGILKEEHQGILVMLEIVDKICQKLDAGEEIPAEHLERIVEFIRVFADRCHHGKEEDLLFVAMEQSGIPRDGGPIGVMLVEHGIGRDFVKGLADAVEKYKAGDRTVTPKISENARGYVNLLTQHIYKEDNILYPMADMHLSQEEQDELVEKFAQVEIERIGVGKHEEFHKLLDYLKGIYLEGNAQAA